MYMDNSAAIRNSEGTDRFSQASRHYRVYKKDIQECVDDKTKISIKEDTDQLTANIMTKAFDKSKFCTHRVKVINEPIE